MGKCPFWSTKIEKVSCYSECPMHPNLKSDEICPFIEFLSGNKIEFKEIVEDEFTYYEENYYKVPYVKLEEY